MSNILSTSFFFFPEKAGSPDPAYSDEIPGKRLTLPDRRSIFSAIFQKGALPMTGSGILSVLSANTELRVRTFVVSEIRIVREA